MTDTLIGTQGDENWVLSRDGANIYVAGNDGYLSVFDAHTGGLLYSVELGADLGAISLSPDGTRLAVVEEVPENVHQYQNWPEDSADVSLYIVDLSTFGAQKLTYHVTGDAYTFADVTWTDDDTLQLSQNILPGWSGWAPLATIELATGALTEHSSYYSGLGTSASLLTIPGSDTVLLGELGLSSAEYFLIAPDGRAVANNGIYNNDVYGYAAGIEAASGTTASDRIIIVTGGGAHLYDGTMSYITNLASLYPNLGYAAGVTFSPDGQRLFFLDSTNNSVEVVDAYNYSVVATVPLTGATFETLKWGDEIVVAPDGHGIYYNTSSGIAYASVDLPGVGTEGADQLSGTAGHDIIDGRGGADVIYGLAGDDWLIGGSGNDSLDGGDGFDIAAYETATSGVRVDLRITGAQATVGADSDTLVSIEGLSGSIFNDTLTGNAVNNLLLGYDGNDVLFGLAGDDDLYGDNGDDQLFGDAGVDWLYGGSGADWLDGGTGADRLEGGDGNDTYVVDNVGDLVIETATGGEDTMRVSNFDATIASGIETLIIVSGAVSATGNFAANILIGSDQNNVLSGLAGNDTLKGFAGDDTLDGGTGADKMLGGAGDDTYLVDNAGDNAYENAGEGTDTVMASVSAALRANVENLTLTGTAGIFGKGNELANEITGNDGANRLSGLAGDDTLVGGAGRDILDGGTGNDTLRGGADNDLYVIDSASDVIVENAGDGTDFVRSSVSYVLSANVERIYLTGSAAIDAIGNAEQNLLVGNGAANHLSGMDNNDHIYGGGGADTLDGGTGNDYLEGGVGQDDLIGGAGKDYFVFRDGDFGGSTAATADRIEDFALGDRISLSPVDANTLTAGNQAFAFVGTAAFSHTAGELRYEQVGGNTFLSGDTNGDGIADFMIKLDGLHTITTSDLLL